MKRAKLSIVGGGLAGALLAVYLARRGFRVTVFERRPDLRESEIPAGRSINLALANRGLAALERVGLAREVRKLLIPMRGRMLHDERGELQVQPYGKDPSEVIYSISRSGLNALLMSAAEALEGVEFRFDHRVEAMDFETGQLTVRDKAQGRNYTVAGGPVICADGAGSRMRRAMQTLEGFHCIEDYLPHDYKELNIPAAANGAHRMEAGALHIWPRGGFMLIALPNLDGSFTVTLFLPRTGVHSFETLGRPDALRRFFAGVFPDVVPLIPSLVEDFFGNPTGRMVTVRCTPWCQGGQLLLIGDAAHAIVPFHGQGMNAAFEDCSELDRCIEQHGDNWARVFREFERSRKANTEAIADMALENYVEMRDTVRDPRFHLQKALAWELERRHQGVFIPRYSMVMFHHIPYAEARRRGAIQKRILDELTRDAVDLEDIDLTLADSLIAQHLAPALPPTGTGHL